MLNKRIIPTLLLSGGALVKTCRFRSPVYVGDPCNTVRIFNELEVDEILILDISRRRHGAPPDFETLKDLASEAFVPLSYGGGVTSLSQAREIFRLGFEKIVVNSLAIDSPDIVTAIAKEFGSQAVVVSIDVKKNIFGKLNVFNPFAQRVRLSVPEFVEQAERIGAGEILLTDVDREGTWLGMSDSELFPVVQKSKIPIIFSGGARSEGDVRAVLYRPEIDAVGVGSLVVFQKRNCGVLINYPFR